MIDINWHHAHTDCVGQAVSAPNLMPEVLVSNPYTETENPD
jgi:hypothetical protein